MADMLRYPSAGCVIEYLEGNAVQIGMVTGDTGERLRVLLPNRRELNLPKNRVLPWIGPQYPTQEGRDEMIRLLEQHRTRRAELAGAINILEVWEMAQGELQQAHARWFAELELSDPDVDQIAAYGQALLACKTHFRFQPPLFQIYTQEEAERRLAEQKTRQEREALLAGGRSFFQLLWEVALGRRRLPPEVLSGRGGEVPSPEVQERLLGLLRTRMLNPLDNETESLWNQLSRGLPEAPQLPLQLLLAWEKVPIHYNVWLAASGYQCGDEWWRGCAEEVRSLAESTESANELALLDCPLVSIDSATTTDIDDAFWLEATENGWSLTMAFACPSLQWAFGGPLDALVRSRGTSLYLPEATCHMLPECLGTGHYSLHAGEPKPAFVVALQVGNDGSLRLDQPVVARVRLAANLHYDEVEAVLNGERSADNPATCHAAMLEEALAMAQVLEARRLRAGAVIIERDEPHVRVEGEGALATVIFEQEGSTRKAQLVVSECMIAAGMACADWARARDLPLLFRTQQLHLPPEYAGKWTAAEDIAKIMHAMVPSLLECTPAPHAALGAEAYAPVTSPLRRYADLVNIAQITAYAASGQAPFEREALGRLLAELDVSLERAGQVQRQRLRYWKLVYFRQKGDRLWWPGVVAEEHDQFVVVYLPNEAMSIRAKRQLFDDRCVVGRPVRVRIGKVQPWWNEIQILEAVAEEACD